MNLMMKDCGSQVDRVKLAQSEPVLQQFVHFPTDLRFIFFFLIPISGIGMKPSKYSERGIKSDRLLELAGRAFIAQDHRRNS